MSAGKKIGAKMIEAPAEGAGDNHRSPINRFDFSQSQLQIGKIFVDGMTLDRNIF